MINEEIAAAYNDLGIGSLTVVIQRDLLDHGAAVIESLYNKRTVQLIHESKLHGASVRGIVSQGRAQQFRIFDQLLNKIRNDESREG